jgi:hypothetical protein
MKSEDSSPKKEKNKGQAEAHDDSIGDAYCFVAIERAHKTDSEFCFGTAELNDNQRFHRRIAASHLSATVPADY